MAKESEDSEQVVGKNYVQRTEEDLMSPQDQRWTGRNKRMEAGASVRRLLQQSEKAEEAETVRK